MKPFKFLHAADLHLGNRQYESDERFRDFARAFQWLLDTAIEKDVDFVLIAGDFFNKTDIKPETFSQVFKLLTNFKENCKKKIPIIAVEGNHDAKPYNTLRSWLQLLAEMDFLYLLDVSEDKDSELLQFSEVNPNTRRGGKFSIGDACIYGVKYLVPSSVRDYLPKFASIIPKESVKFNIFLSHFGIEGMEDDKTGVAYDASFAPLKECTDYIALGHFHKSYQLNDWIYNPGSLESNSISEYNYLEKEMRGVFYVEVNGKTMDQRKVELISPPNRKFITESVDIGHLPSFSKSIDYIKEKLSKVAFFKSIPLRLTYDLDKPVFTLIIKGKITFSKTEISLKDLELWIQENLDVLISRIELKTENFTKDLNITYDEVFSIQKIEKATFEAIIAENSMYAPVMAEIVDFMQELKPIVSSKIDTPELVIESIEKWYISNQSRIGQSDEKLPEIPQEEQNQNELAQIDAKIGIERKEQTTLKRKKVTKSPSDKPIKKPSTSKGLDAFGLKK